MTVYLKVSIENSNIFLDIITYIGTYALLYFESKPLLEVYLLIFKYLLLIIVIYIKIYTEQIEIFK